MTTIPSEDLIRRFDRNGPRYTSYPTADRFVEAFDAMSQGWWLMERATRSSGRPIAVYVHVPFCESVCYYCACNKIATRDRSHGSRYVTALKREIALYAERMTADNPICQLHLGGGTPTFLSDDEIGSLLDALAGAFGFVDGAELSIEVDPRTVDTARLARLRTAGFNRISFGVQDVEPAVQQAVHRVQSTDRVFELVDSARALGFASINVDLIYGLPMQTAATFARTMQTIVRLRPDRIAVYAYAHLPERFKPQRRIDTATLPAGADKLAMLREAIATLGGAGYDYIGMDHFALPDDSLAVAHRRGSLQRNFMGYTTLPDCDLLGFGVSAIGAIGPTYAQNHRELDHYLMALENGELPIARGIELTPDDLLRRAAIMGLMCGGELNFALLEDRFLVDPRIAFRRELAALDEHQRLGLVTIDRTGVRVTPTGQFFLRPIARVFDRYIRRRADEVEDATLPSGKAAGEKPTPAPAFSRLI